MAAPGPGNSRRLFAFHHDQVGRGDSHRGRRNAGNAFRPGAPWGSELNARTLDPELYANPHFILGMIKSTLESDRAPRQKTEAIGKILLEWEEAKQWAKERQGVAP